jgi:hypothetical protein
VERTHRFCCRAAMKRKPGARDADGESAEARLPNNKRLRLYERGGETIAASAGGGLDIASYFAVRSAKLKDQGGATCSSIFRDCRFYVNTCCANGAQLRHLIHKHGADVSLGPTVGSLTHIVAENLNASKIDAMVGRAGAKYICVVKPQFIYASVAAGRRLSEREFRAIDDAFQPALTFPQAAGLRDSVPPAAGAGGVESRCHLEKRGMAHAGCSNLGSTSAAGAERTQHRPGAAVAAAAACAAEDARGCSAQTSVAFTGTAGVLLCGELAGARTADAAAATGAAGARGPVSHTRPAVPRHAKHAARVPTATRSWAKFASALPDPRLLCAGTVGHQDAYSLQTAALATTSAAGLAGGVAASKPASAAAARHRHGSNSASWQ